MTGKYYLTGGGGLGDLIRSYLKDDLSWGKIKGIKKQNPSTHLKAILVIHNPGATDFLSANPYIDEIVQFPWQLDGTPVFNANKGQHEFIRHFPHIDKIPYSQPTIYLTEEDKKIYQEIVKQNYVAIHPFAGLGDRIAMPIAEYFPLVDNLIAAGFVPVIMGTTYSRVNSGGQDPQKEIFEYTTDKMYNLVSKGNPRLFAKLAQNAKGFIGTHSCYILPAWVAGTRSCLVAPRKLQKHLETGDANSWVTRQQLPFNRTYYIEEGTNNYDIIRKGILDFLRK